MQKIGIKNESNALEITDIVLGAGQLGVDDHKSECYKILDYYLEKGGNCLDVARSYAGGACEEELGRFLRLRNVRNKVLISSKGGFPLERSGMHISRLSKQELTYDLEESLKALGTEAIDIYFLHRDDCNIPVEEIMPVLDTFVKQGKIRTLGASNWTCGRIGLANAFAQANSLTPFSVSQINWSLALTTPPLTGDITHIVMNSTEKDWYQENAFPVMAYSAQAKGFFTKYFSGNAQKLSGERSYFPLSINLRRAERLKELSAQLLLPMSVLLLSYIRSQSLPAAAIGGFSSLRQAKEGLAAENIRLTKEQIAYLETI